MGVGLLFDLSDLMCDFPDVALLFILSDVCGVNIVLRKWLRKNRLLDAIVIEHLRYVGGYFGAMRAEEINDLCFDFEPVWSGIFSLFCEFGIERERILLILVGGINIYDKVRRLIVLGVVAVQIGMFFVVIEEGDAYFNFKQVLVEVKSEDIVIFMSVAGLFARVVLMSWFKNYLKREKALQSYVKADPCRCVLDFNCLIVCGLRDGIAVIGQFCIDMWLAFVFKGDVMKGLFFRGSESLPFGVAIRPVVELIDYFLIGRMLVLADAVVVVS